MKRSTKRTMKTGSGLIALVLALIVAGWLLSAWWLMLGVGIAHRDWWPLMPVMSYHVALILALFTTVPVIGSFAAKSSK